MIRRKTGAVALASALLLTLAACGGGSDNNSGAANNASADSNTSAQTGSGSTGSTDSTPSTNASFFDGIFMKDTGAGYWQFNLADSSALSGTGVPLPSGRTQYFVNSDSDANFSMAFSPVAGQASQSNENRIYVTSEGAFTSQTTGGGTDVGTNSKIFSKQADGFELGVQGMATPLYRVTIKTVDVSGQTIADTIIQDENEYPAGLYRLMNDATPMPAGSQLYLVPHAILTTYIGFTLANLKSSAQTLEQAQAQSSGEILSLGGYRYLTNPSSTMGVMVDYNGAIYYATLYPAGDVYSAVGAGYNTVAADFLSARLSAALSQ